MKSAYELAMERLNKAAPTVKLSDAQKKDLSEIESGYAAKIAGREIALRDEIGKFTARGELEKAAEMEQQLAFERKTLQAKLEAEKEQVRRRTRTK
ncbi:MAG: hypothetical protein EXS35_08305 [Pedosphaera sp.]|nr:hypothetical protein [Pedosphaera sp.]